MDQIEVIDEYGEVEKYIEINTTNSKTNIAAGDTLRLLCGKYKVVEVVHEFVNYSAVYAYISYRCTKL